MYWSIATFKHSDGFDFKEVFGIGEARDQVAAAYPARLRELPPRPVHAVGVDVSVEAMGACFRCMSRFPAAGDGRSMSIDKVSTASQGSGLDR